MNAPMVLRVDLSRPEEGDMGVDPRVKVRFGFLVRNWTRLDSREIDRRLREKALEESPGASLNDLIKKMIKEVAYGQARLSLKEFEDRFRKNKLAEVIAMRFVNSLFEIDVEQRGDDSMPFSGDDFVRKNGVNPEQIVLRNVTLFLERNKLTSTETLYEFLRQQKVDWPMVEMHRLFLAEYEEVGYDGQVRRATLKEKVARKIDDSLASIAAEAYREKFNEDKRGFVMGFMIGRVVRYDRQAKKMIFDRREFRDLVAYLDSIGYDISNFEGRTLYDWLYYDSREMAKYIEEQKVNSARMNTRERLVEVGVLEDGSDSDDAELFFNEDFNVKAFHDRYIKPELFKFYSKKLKKLGRVREIDLLHGLHDVGNLGRTNYTLQLRHYLRTLLTVQKNSPGQFLQKIKEIFGLQKSPLLSTMSNQDVQKHFEYFLDQAKSKFETVVMDALSYRNDSEIHQACAYPKEILNCRDIASLMEWFVNPAAFKELYPAHATLPDEQVAYMCSAFLREFMNVMEKMSSRDFVEAEHRRNLLEEDMKRSLQIKYVQTLDVEFQMIEEVDEKGSSFTPPRYDTVINPSGIGEFVNDYDLQLAKEIEQARSVGNGVVLIKGRYYRLHNLESKKFKKIQMKIPRVRFDAVSGTYVREGCVNTVALVYSGDDHYIHLKGALTRVISQDRGKEVTDECRWMLSFADIAGQEAFKSFLYSRNPKGLVKNEDVAENRFISNKRRKPVVTASSTSTFKKGQEFVHTMKMSYVTGKIKKKDDHEKWVEFLQTEQMMLETQCQKLRELLITNLSKYSISSHDVYRAQRAWPLLFSYYFPPEIFGDKYKFFQDQGFQVPK